MLIRFMATLSILAGFGAGAGGAWANFFAYKSMMPDTEFSWVFGLLGIVFSLSSISAFSLFYWNRKSGQNISETVVSLLVGLLASGGGIYGTTIYLQSLDADRIAESELTESRRAIVTAQVEDLRVELRSLPQGLGTVDSIETYLEEVETVGRTHERPYRLKQIELGQARRRDDLGDQISELEERLLTDEALVQVPVQKKQYTLILAIVLEILATQGAAIGFTVFVPKVGTATEGAWMDAVVSANLRN